MSSSQMPLFGPGESWPAATVDRLFFAVQPDAGAAMAALDIAARLRARYGLKSKPMASERLHISLHLVGEFPGVPQNLVARACKALAAFEAAPFELRFDRVMSFRSKEERPLVLVGGNSLEPLCQFRKQLRNVLVRAQVPERDKQSFKPHVTLLRDYRVVPGQDIEPVCWTAREFVLVHSLHGHSQHRVLARFPLAGNAGLVSALSP